MAQPTFDNNEMNKMPNESKPQSAPIYKKKQEVSKQ